MGTNGSARTRDGVAISFTLHERGSGSARIVLVHSVGLDRSVWDGVVAALAPRASVLVYDARGHGASGKPAGPYTVQLFADDLADLLDAAGWESAVVVGGSMGGCVLAGVRDRLSAAARRARPGRYDGLVR